MNVFAGVRVSKSLTVGLAFLPCLSCSGALPSTILKTVYWIQSINQAGMGFGLCYKTN